MGEPPFQLSAHSRHRSLDWFDHLSSRWYSWISTSPNFSVSARPTTKGC